LGALRTKNKIQQKKLTKLDLSKKIQKNERKEIPLSRNVISFNIF